MAITTEGKYAGCFVVADEGETSREAVTVLSGQNLKAGHVVGRVTKGIGRVSIPTVVGTGNGTASLVFPGPDIEVGNYVVTCTTAVANGGVFSVVTPSGLRLPDLTLTPGSGNTTAYTSSHINFSITDNTDFVAGDVFTFVVGTTAPTVIGGTGTGTISLLTLGPDALTGRYKVICTAAVSQGGVFEVINPIGASLGTFPMTPGSTSASTFTTRQLGFTLTDATDFIVGNYFDVAVYNVPSAKVVEFDPTTFDGRHIPAGLSWDNYDATSADVAGVIEARRCQVNAGEFTWKSTVSAAEKANAAAYLTARGVVVR